jgi:hypothetical protein
MKKQHDSENWTFCARDLGGKLGCSYAVDLPNGARIFTSSNDKAEAHMRQVSTVPQLVRACRLLVQAYTNGTANDAHVDWDNIDSAHDAAQQALGMAGVAP